MGERTTVIVTQEWQQVAAGIVVIEIAVRGKGCLFINQDPTEVNAKHIVPDINEQFWQNETVPTWVRSEGEGWELWVDGDL